MNIWLILLIYFTIGIILGYLKYKQINNVIEKNNMLDIKKRIINLYIIFIGLFWPIYILITIIYLIYYLITK